MTRPEIQAAIEKTIREHDSAWAALAAYDRGEWGQDGDPMTLREWLDIYEEMKAWERASDEALVNFEEGLE